VQATGATRLVHRERPFGLQNRALVCDSTQRGDAKGKTIQRNRRRLRPKSGKPTRLRRAHNMLWRRALASFVASFWRASGRFIAAPTSPCGHALTVPADAHCRLRPAARIEQGSLGIEPNGANAAMCGEIRGTSRFGEVGNDFHTRAFGALASGGDG